MGQLSENNKCLDLVSSQGPHRPSPTYPDYESRLVHMMMMMKMMMMMMMMMMGGGYAEEKRGRRQSLCPLTLPFNGGGCRSL